MLSGICVTKTNIFDINKVINELRSARSLNGEIKWTKVSNYKYKDYEALASLFFDLAAKGLIHFHSMLIDTQQLNHKAYNSGDKEIGFSKFVYQLLLKFGRIYQQHEHLECYLDKRTTKHSLSDLQHVLNNGIRSRWGRPYGTYSRVHFLDSKKSNLLQLNDVLLGALSSRANSHHLRTKASPSKVDLSTYICRRAGIHAAIADTPRDKTWFSTWNFRLRR